MTDAPTDHAIAQYPHCDSRVLHAPGQCRYCDDLPTWQALRETWGIAFTGQPAGPGQTPCPSDAVRGLAGAHVWGGNRPQGMVADHATQPVTVPNLLSAHGQVSAQRPDGSWGPAQPLDWYEEHTRPQRVILWLLGRGHCGKPGRRG